MQPKNQRRVTTKHCIPFCNARFWAMLLAVASNSLGFSQSPISYAISGLVGKMERSGPSPALATNAYFRIELTITEFTATVPQFGPYGNFAVASALVTAPAFGISNAPVLNGNLELIFFDNGYREQFSLHLILSSSRYSRTYDTILLDSYGLDFIANPRVPAPLNQNLDGISMEIGGSWRHAFQLGNGTTLGSWYGDFDAVLENVAVVPEPTSAGILIIGVLLLAPRLRLSQRDAERPGGAGRDIILKRREAAVCSPSTGA